MPFHIKDLFNIKCMLNRLNSNNPTIHINSGHFPVSNK